MSLPVYQTVVQVPEYKHKTGYSYKNMFMGSCFTENIGNLMDEQKYQVDINPFGILYNPYSVAEAINRLLENRQFTGDDLIQHNGLWHSFSHHGRFSSFDKESVLETINGRLAYSSSFLEEADFLFITLGTAWVYRYNQTGMVVANCHKMPDKQFDRFKVNVAGITDVLGSALKNLLHRNPNLNIIFTVSPIRHWKDGAIENQRSKAALLLAVEELIGDIGDNSCSYFPAYEIVMDELRDYRFYAEDMLHPSSVAIKHIWEKFQAALIEPESLKIAKEVQKIKLAMNHKPINKFTEENLAFLNQTLKKLDLLTQRYPFMNFKPEMQTMIGKINEIEIKNR